MVIYCTHCGEMLPRKDARFCRHCGMLVPSHPLSFQSLTTSKDATPLTPSSTPIQSEGDKPASQEHPADPQPSQSDKQDTSTKSSHDEDLADQSVANPSGQPQEKNDAPEEIEFRDTVALSAIQEQAAHDEDVEYIELHDIIAPSVPDEQITPDKHVEDIESRDTLALSVPDKQVAPDEHAENIESRDTLLISTLEQAEVQSLQTPLLPESETRKQDKNDEKPPSIAASVPSKPPVQQNKRYFPLAIAISLVVLLVGGIGTWLLIFQPFSVSPITDPTQAFKDTNLGVSLLYPTGWIVQRDRGIPLVHIHDSSQTAQVSISVKNDNTSDLAQFLQKQATGIGMTGIKHGPPISFAGASWQQIQGTIQQDGANYRGSIFATLRGNRLFMFVQQAHQSVYTQEDMLIFFPMRSSLQIF